MPVTNDTPGFGVYIHWPFCAQKCPYCDFNSHVRLGGWDEPRYLAAYKRELDHVARLLTLSPAKLPHPQASVRSRPSSPQRGEGQGEGAGATRTVTSIFFGGGTPSLMKPETVGAILDHIAALWSVAPDAEITLEANPGSVEAARFAGYRVAGVNRVSIGVQSLREADLRRLGRIHSVDEAKDALAIAHRTFDRVSFDLIYARPGQRPADWRAELSEALALASGHLSLYQLTIEPDTRFADLYAKGRLAIPAAEDAHELYELTQELTAAAGLPPYEISNHARPGQESRHNLLYWRYGEYAGVGPGAHGRLHAPDAYLATATERAPERWLERVETAGHGVTEAEPLSPEARADEMLLMGLRLEEGLDLDRLALIGGRAPHGATLTGLIGHGLIERIAPPDEPPGADEIRACLGPGLAPAAPPSPAPLGRIRATEKGRFVLNRLVLELSASFEPMAHLALP